MIVALMAAAALAPPTIINDGSWTGAVPLSSSVAQKGSLRLGPCPHDVSWRNGRAPSDQQRFEIQEFARLNTDTKIARDSGTGDKARTPISSERRVSNYNVPICFLDRDLRYNPD